MTRHANLLTAIALALASGSTLAGGVAANVGIDGFTYTPANVSIQAGETVSFVATGFHPLALDDSTTITCSEDCNVTFLTAGTYGFYCDNHGGPGGAGMAGTVTVTGFDFLFTGTFEHTMP